MLKGVGEVSNWGREYRQFLEKLLQFLAILWKTRISIFIFG